MVTVVPDEKTYEHVEPQLIPPTSEVTVPPPVPDLEMESVNDCAFVPITITAKQKNKIHGFLEYRECKLKCEFFIGDV